MNGSARPGWYADPTGTRMLRWWDGERWTDDVRAVPPPSEWTPLRAAVPSRGSVGVAVSVGVSATMLAALTIVGLSMIREVPLPYVDLFPYLALPVVIVCQLWLLRVTGGNTALTRREGLRVAARLSWFEFLRGFDRLPRSLAWLFFLLTALAFVAVLVTPPLLDHGVPVDGMAGCPFRLDNHGTFTCVSHQVYLQTGAALQRLLPAVIGVISATQAAAAVGYAWYRPAPSAGEPRPSEQAA